MLIHRGKYVQSGAGLGNFLGKIFKKVWPVITDIFSSAPVKQVTSDVKDSALNAGLNLASDIIQGENVKDSLEKNAKQFGKNVGQSVITTADSFLTSNNSSKKRPAAQNVKPQVKIKKPKVVKKNIKRKKLNYL